MNLTKLFISLIVFIIIGVISIIPINWGVLDPIGKALTDFDIYDIVFSKLRTEQNIDTNIVIVNIGNLDRVGIANQIAEISKNNPKVIGLDVFFLHSKDKYEDSLLSQVIKSTKNLIIINKLENYNQADDRYESTLESSELFNTATKGYVNLPEDKKGGFRTIRYFRPLSQFNDKIVHSFAVKIVEMFDKQSIDFLFNRNNKIEQINYRGNFNKFYFLDKDAFNNNSDLQFIRDKIVILGFVGINQDSLSLEDKFFTPLNQRYAGKTFPDMYGVVIHANIISMILNRNYINELPKIFSIILALIICYFNVSFLLYIKRKLIDLFGGISKVFILLQTMLLLIIGILLLYIFNYKVHLTLFMAVIALVPSSIDFFQNYIHKLFSRKRKEIKRR